MSRTIRMTLDPASINAAIKALKAYEKWLRQKSTELTRRLAELGAVNVSLGYARAVYSGTKDITITVEPIPNGYKVMASGEAILFVEFGAGITYGAGHPQAGEFGMGAGTYPDGKGHWDDPRGWYIPKEHGGGHTYGNPPNPVMYQTAKQLEAEIIRVAREVFAT